MKKIQTNTEKKYSNEKLQQHQSNVIDKGLLIGYFNVKLKKIK